jgi:hypothetical protein
MVKNKKDENVHVCLHDPLNKRREILQATIDVVQLMKKYENIKRIRYEKEQALAEFKKCMGSINFLFRRVNLRDMPLDSQDLKGYKLPKKQETGIVEPVMKKVKKVLVKQEVEKKPTLDRQLDELQRRLNSL